MREWRHREREREREKGREGGGRERERGGGRERKRCRERGGGGREKKTNQRPSSPRSTGRNQRQINSTRRRQTAQVFVQQCPGAQHASVAASQRRIKSRSRRPRATFRLLFFSFASDRKKKEPEGEKGDNFFSSLAFRRFFASRIPGCATRALDPKEDESTVHSFCSALMGTGRAERARSGSEKGPRRSPLNFH